MRLSFFISSLSLSFNIVPHKLNILRDSVINAIEIILGGGLGMAYKYKKDSTVPINGQHVLPFSHSR